MAPLLPISARRRRTQVPRWISPQATAGGRCTGGASGRSTADVDTPEGTIANTQSRGGFGNVGVSWTGARELRGRELRLRRHEVRHSLRGRRIGRAHSASSHVRGEGRRIGTRRAPWRDIAWTSPHAGTSTRSLSAAKWARASKTTPTRSTPGCVIDRQGDCLELIGGWFLNRSFTAIGEEALSPPVKEKGYAAFFYEELTWPQ